jgi:hypothetical protein
MNKKIIVTVKNKVLSFIGFTILYTFLIALIFNVFFSSVSDFIMRLVPYTIAVILTLLNFFSKTIVNSNDFQKLGNIPLVTNGILNFLGVVILLPFGIFNLGYFFIRLLVFGITSLLIYYFLKSEIKKYNNY